MKTYNSLSKAIILSIIALNLLITSVSISNIYQINSNSDNIKPQTEIRDGKIYKDIASTNLDCYINRYQPNLNNQPKTFIGDWNLAHADMSIENLMAINYTKEIETDPSEFIDCHPTIETYYYQKFSVETSQYINNISLFIQDINDRTIYNETNSWEVSVMNCSNDYYGTPDENGTIATLMKPHPYEYAAHWEVFDFLTSIDGPVFLNINNTISTIEDGITKYWFAFRIKIPPNDVGPKFLYFNPDGFDLSNRGEGDTFKKYDEWYYENFTINYVTEDIILTNGTKIQGNDDSFNVTDSDRYIAEANTNNLTLELNFRLRNFTSASIEDIVSIFTADQPARDLWEGIHFLALMSIDFYLTMNISNSDTIDDFFVEIKNVTSGLWYDANDMFNITQAEESTMVFKISEPAEKLAFLEWFVNTSTNNSVDVRFGYYDDDGQFNISINELVLKIGERIQINDTVKRYDPMVQTLTAPSDVEVINGTQDVFDESDLFNVTYNDDKYFRVQADTNNVSIEFKINMLPGVNKSLWDDVDWWDWVTFIDPYPYIPFLDFRLSCNVSINSPYNLSLATLELYKGKENFTIYGETLEDEWIMVADTNTSLAIQYELPMGDTIFYDTTWIFLQMVNSSDDNSLKMRFRYLGNGTFENFNVTIDEFSMLLYVQNIVPSDLASKIGFGINSNKLKPSDIEMKNKGIIIVDNGNQKGTWDENIDNGGPVQGIYEFNVTSLWNSITFDVVGTYEVFKIIPVIEFVDTLESQYMTGTNYFSVKVTDNNGDPIENLEIKFEVLDADGSMVYETTAVSNSEGIASASLDFKKTGERYTVRVGFEEEGIYYTTEITSEEFRIVNEFVLFMDTVQLFMPLIILIIAVLSMTFYVMHRKKARLKEIWAKDALILDDLLKITYVMVIHKEVGVAIYNKQITLEVIDSDLISGFLHAISQFRKELKADKGTEGEKQGIEMDYYNSKIVITDGEYTRVALILDGSPSEKLKESQWAFTKEFEKNFWPMLDNFTGDIAPFREADPLVEKHFNISLMFPLRLGEYIDSKSLKPLEKALVEVAEQMQKERKFFFISSLLSYGIAGRKEAKDQVVSAILALRKNGAIVPIPME